MKLERRSMIAQAATAMATSNATAADGHHTNRSRSVSTVTAMPERSAREWPDLNPVADAVLASNLRDDCDTR
jgi:hypothetical protein